jgi:hypothetical protein
VTSQLSVALRRSRGHPPRRGRSRADHRPRRLPAPQRLHPPHRDRGQLLQFLDDWLSTDHGPVDESLTRFVGCEAYGVESLRDDLARFTFLLGESDGEGLFSPRTPG